MKWTSALAIYLLFWVMTAFLVLPFGVKTHDEAGIPKTPGQADSAPANFRPARVALWTTALSAVLFGLFYLNYVNGWVGAEAFDLFRHPG
ncbi:DUF1467 family protein [Sphingomonas cavernae]|uniref:DUF1467 family protein n=1 Tax=Sphingomonas cavernae TaxID=2320861 RepID=A0A418W5K6_9SPHN|nr:DUF1467 family protein [Sphingomonas cavernae]RJF85321.1 DUF1467 family protein [Sphingomonas cavernae]